MIDMNAHAKISADMRQAANWADDLAKSLRALNQGPVFDHDTEKLVESVDMAYSAISRLLGKETP
ncbi:hypothetical protein [Rhizobium laguerreae]|uniref:hypothetical protein n=1 Tax=Rhizobium laguerreae TaxID=1076926 RepID=UPI001C923CB0|nr:hypothetical protein [Rhizobium laguerreae]MBY3434789.1 hypothetical protein [Rhizobium laguerreae]MBY3448932.1 hypothetical protein [Rhizobium laguerreae]MBY3456706.1 hypothetical protein [Rhizobium laguerreae]